MGKLRELLAKEADTFRAEKAKRQQVVGEWLGMLGDLFARIDGWLKACDPEGLLDVTAPAVELNDPALGEYRAPTRRIGLGKREIEIVPRARYVIATILPDGDEKPVRPHGLVEIRSRDWPTHSIYQLPDRGWFIRSTANNMNQAGDNPVEPLDADHFESALAGVLR